MALEEIKTEEENILKSLNVSLPEFFRTLLDVVGTAIINTIIGMAPFVKKGSKKKAMIKSLFKKSESQDEQGFQRLPKKIVNFPKRGGGFTRTEIG